MVFQLAWYTDTLRPRARHSLLSHDSFSTTHSFDQQHHSGISSLAPRLFLLLRSEIFWCKFFSPLLWVWRLISVSAKSYARRNALDANAFLKNLKKSFIENTHLVGIVRHSSNWSSILFCVQLLMNDICFVFSLSHSPGVSHLTNNSKEWKEFFIRVFHILLRAPKNNWKIERRSWKSLTYDFPTDFIRSGNAVSNEYLIKTCRQWMPINE